MSFLLNVIFRRMEHDLCLAVYYSRVSIKENPNKESVIQKIMKYLETSVRCM